MSETAELFEAIEDAVAALVGNGDNRFAGANDSLKKDVAAALAALRTRLGEQTARQERTLYISEHLWQMIPQSVWRDSGGDDMQGHYEGDFHAEKVREELAELRAALSQAERAGQRPLTMQDRLLATAHVEMLTTEDPTLRVIADRIIDCVRCCGEFPECSHVLAEADRVAERDGQ